MVFAASAASVSSQWCFAEVSLARSLAKPVFPPWAGLRLARLDPADAFAWDPTRSPYPGLEAFAGGDAAVFFGRDQEIDRLLELLQPTLQRGPGRFVAIVGPCGSGKSSLLRAGLLPLPRLARLPARWVLLPVLRPAGSPRITWPAAWRVP